MRRAAVVSAAGCLRVAARAQLDATESESWTGSPSLALKGENNRRSKELSLPGSGIWAPGSGGRRDDPQEAEVTVASMSNKKEATREEKEK